VVYCSPAKRADPTGSHELGLLCDVGHVFAVAVFLERTKLAMTTEIRGQFQCRGVIARKVGAWVLLSPLEGGQKKKKSLRASRKPEIMNIKKSVYLTLGMLAGSGGNVQ